MLGGMEALVRAVELKSISAAARRLRISAAAASHRIQQLEDQLGVRLLDRSTHSVRPTEAGRLFYGHAIGVLAAVGETENAMALATGVASGPLRVAAPLSFGRRILSELVVEFQKQHPNVEIGLRLSDRPMDLMSEPLDVVVCLSESSSGGHVLCELADCPRLLCAAPSYLAQHDAPETPEDLLRHNCLLQRFPGSNRRQWTLQGADGPTTLTVTGRLDADDGDVLTTWALNGEGIVLKAYWEVAEDLRAGRLHPVLPNHPPTPSRLLMIYPHRHLPPAQVLAFADFMAEAVPKLLFGSSIPPAPAAR